TMDAWLKGVTLDPKAVERMRALGLSWREEIAKYPHLRGKLERDAPAPNAVAETRFLDSRTRLERHEEIIGEALARLAQSSHSQILIQSPYLVLSQEAVDMLARVGARGVKITVLTNSPISSDNA